MPFVTNPHFTNELTLCLSVSTNGFYHYMLNSSVSISFKCSSNISSGRKIVFGALFLSGLSKLFPFLTFYIFFFLNWFVHVLFNAIAIQTSQLQNSCIIKGDIIFNFSPYFAKSHILQHKKNLWFRIVSITKATMHGKKIFPCWKELK